MSKAQEMSPGRHRASEKKISDQKDENSTNPECGNHFGEIIIGGYR